MLEDIVYSVKASSGGTKEIKVVPDLVFDARDQKRRALIFYLYIIVPKEVEKGRRKDDDEVFIAYAGAIKFVTQDYINYRYEGRVLTEYELTQLVAFIQNHAMDWTTA